MKRPHLPAMPALAASEALPPSCFEHGPYGTAGYCRACAAARIDTDRAMFPELPVRHRRRRRFDRLAKATTITLLTAAAVVLAAYTLVWTGVLTWH